MAVRLIGENEKDRWNTFVSSSPKGSFLQSFEWGELQKRVGLSVWRIIHEEGGSWQAVALVIQRPLPLGRSWLYVPRGPIGKWGDEFGKKLTEVAEKEGAIFVRVDPAIPTPLSRQASTTLPFVRGGKWHKSEREVQPRNTLVLDLDKSEDELLAAMHHKTRYNIRLAQKKGVSVRFSKDVRDVEHFLRLAREVHGRGSFSYHPDEYYREMVRVLAGGSTPEGVDLELAIAEFEGQVLAVNVIVYFGTTATYAHGASSSALREVMAPHLLQWENIRRAKRRGFKMYDFFGVAPEDAGPHHPWAGVTRFKLGFGGRRVDYMGAYDLVLSEGMYHLFNAARRLRGMLRG